VNALADPNNPRAPGLIQVYRCRCGRTVSAMTKQSASEALAEHHRFERATASGQAEIREP